MVREMEGDGPRHEQVVMTSVDGTIGAVGSSLIGKQFVETPLVAFFVETEVSCMGISCKRGIHAYMLFPAGQDDRCGRFGLN